MDTTLFRYNPWWESLDFTDDLIERKQVTDKLFADFSNKDVILLTGLRRIGKTSSIKLLIKRLITQNNVLPQRILYISLDNYLLNNFSILDITERFMQIQNIRFGEKMYLFFDEITYKPDFEVQLKNLYDHYNSKIVATSSSSSLLKERKDLLTGRHRVRELLPLDFDEFMQFKNIRVGKADAHLLPGYFHEYLKTGGIPEFVISGNMDYLNNLVDNIIHKDIAALNNIKHVGVLKDYFLLLMERSGKQMSINKISNILKISPDTSRRYFDLFRDSFLIHPVMRFGTTNEQLLSPKKIYAPDLGIRNAFTGERDFGSLFENYVYLKIKYLNPHYVYENGIELDFMTQDKRLAEVKYHNEPLSDKQQLLFDTTDARKKSVIRNHTDIEAFLIE